MRTCGTPDERAQQYRRQRGWTADFRGGVLDDVLDAVGAPPSASRVLEVGCGSGEILHDLLSRGCPEVTGLDRDREILARARESCPAARYVHGDAHSLPFSNGAFDIAYCHLTLMWIGNPAAVLGEMARVVRPGGAVAALAEPDYGGRVDAPRTLPYRELIINGLTTLGAHPSIGRILPRLFQERGLHPVWGVFPFRWGNEDLVREFDREWEMNERLFSCHFTKEQLASARAEEYDAVQAGTRVVTFPLFWAYGITPGDMT